MLKSGRASRALAIGLALITCFLLALGYFFWPRTPRPGSDEYEKYVDAFELGIAALDADLREDAEKYLGRAIQLIPEEPAAWANRGLLYLRTSRLEESETDLNQANTLAPTSGAIKIMLAMLEERRGQFGKAAAYLRQAVELEPDNIEAIYRLALVVDQEQLQGSDDEYQRLMERLIALRPQNLMFLLEHLKVAARRSDRNAVDRTLVKIEEFSTSWSEPPRMRFHDLKKKLATSLGRTSVREILPLSNLLLLESSYRQSIAELSSANMLLGTTLQNFLRLPPIRHVASPPDMDLTFASEPLRGIPAGIWSMVLPVWLSSDAKPDLLVANLTTIQLVGKDVVIPSPDASPQGIQAFDWNNDARIDLLLAGSRGMRFFQQMEGATFVDVSDKTKLDPDILGDDYFAAWPVDIDADGDLDIVLARNASGPSLLRNNFDGTFTVQSIIVDKANLRDFVWADVDDDGTNDIAALDERGQLQVYANERGGRFAPWPTQPSRDTLVAIAAADANDDGIFDLVALGRDGTLIRISDRDKRASWDIQELARSTPIPDDMAVGRVFLAAADVDNSGTVDFLASHRAATQIWLGSGDGKFQAMDPQLPIQAVADVDLDGRIDLLSPNYQQPMVLSNRSTKGYHWQFIQPRAVASEQASGDNRINSFALGGHVEVRSGSFVNKQPISAPIVHFGLGDRKQASVVRIVWPNGSHQVELLPQIDQVIVSEQRLKTSCPFLFAFNGKQFEFVKDFMWSSPLGMYINAQTKGGFQQTTDWVRIRGDQLLPREGKYEVRVQANLWETHFFDQLALAAVDHPADTELFVDERFFLQPTPPMFHLTDLPSALVRARDQNGQDASKELRAVDGVYLDRCQRGIYQGIASEHWVEFELPPREVAPDAPIWLIATGWVHPTDSSINFAIEQGEHEKPHGLILEAEDSQGGWHIVNDQIGFPAGKLKTVLVRLDETVATPKANRFRLRTNMEIYWDALQIARGRDHSSVIRNDLSPSRSELRFRGILDMHEANRSSPELPIYERIVSQRQYWRDLIGFYTRLGDVRELIETIDDRYVIATAGDEIVFEFPTPSDPPPGWKRDFIWISDGWVKDGDLNTGFSKTVLPLPWHGMTSYDEPPRRLEDDRVYQEHADDWNNYHTRFITPTMYERGLRTFSRPLK